MTSRRIAWVVAPEAQALEVAAPASGQERVTLDELAPLDRLRDRSPYSGHSAWSWTSCFTPSR